MNFFSSAFNFLAATVNYSRYNNNGIPTDNGILILTKANFREIIQSNDFLMVKFYVPWCVHCKKFAPEFLKTAQLLNEQQSPVRLGQVDVSEEEYLGYLYGINEYPTMKFFKRGIAINYHGSKKASEIVKWVIQRIQ